MSRRTLSDMKAEEAEGDTGSSVLNRDGSKWRGGGGLTKTGCVRKPIRNIISCLRTIITIKKIFE